MSVSVSVCSKYVFVDMWSLKYRNIEMAKYFLY